MSKRKWITGDKWITIRYLVTKTTSQVALELNIVLKQLKKKLSMATLLYQGFALLMDQTGVDTVLVEEVILKPGMFPSSQTSLITHEKLILLFCSLYNTIMADFKESFLFP